MARIDRNGLVLGARGNFGKQFVYKKRGKRTHIVSMPTVSKGDPTSEQAGVRRLFKLASLYAKAAMNNLEIKKQYQKIAGDEATAMNMASRIPAKTGVSFAIRGALPVTRIIVIIRNEAVTSATNAPAAPYMPGTVTTKLTAASSR